MAKRHPRDHYAYDGNLAYNLDTLARELDRQETGQPYREIPKKEEPQVAPKPKQQTQASPLMMGAFVVLAVMVVVLLAGYVRLTQVSNEISRQKKNLANLKDEYVELLAEHEKAFDMNTIKAVAEEAGMSQPSSGQIEYVDLSSGDSTIIYEAQTPTLMKTVFASASGGVLSLVEFFR